MKNQREGTLLGLVSQLPHGLCCIDADETVLVVNHAFETLFGLEHSVAMLGRELHELIEQLPDGELKTVFAELTGTSGVDGSQRVAEIGAGRSVTLSKQVIEAGGYAVLFELSLAEPKAGIDSLTGLPNRDGFFKLLREACQSSPDEFALLYLDLDRFKHINDTYGHNAGDQVLTCVVDRIRRELRSGDRFARLGGDEFVVLQSDCGQPDGSHALSRRIIDSVSRPIHFEGHSLGVGVSIGVAIFPFDADSSSNLLKAADLAMYSSKEAGRNRLRYFEPAMNDRLQARHALESSLLNAIEDDQFELFYQPVKDVTTDSIVTVEALIRWNHPRLGRVDPEQFISVAEESGLIVQLGEWVLREACREAMQWPETIRVAVNVSAVQLRDRRFSETVAKVLEETGLDAGRLELEVTETALVADADLTIAILDDLRTRGVQIALDDFGTGYSSINYLRRFPFDKLKIDRSFVSNATADSESAAIVRMIAALGVSLSVATTAEGVETESEIEMVRDAGCSQIQGYALSRPVPANELLTLLHPQISGAPSV
ncbi:MAG: EAL domain-containing protein [Planctomycetota bacterium]